MDENKEKQKKSGNKFTSALKAIFVHNIGWKLLAFGTAIVVWALAVGLW